LQTRADAKKALTKAWPHIVAECRQVLGSELHYQAIVYHCLRLHGGVPINQIGMNVKMWIRNPVSELFRQLDVRKKLRFQGGFEPIPDVSLFAPALQGDWRRRNHTNTLQHLLLAIEVKASERKNSRLQSGELISDIRKLAAHRQEAQARGWDFLPVMMVIDTARDAGERTRAHTLDLAKAEAKTKQIALLYMAPAEVFSSLEEIGEI
jgi:hypothetical protein